MPKNNEWAIPKNIDKPIETVYEIKNEYDVPSFEEFMKTYERDEKVNYDDLSGGSVGEVKGYGPCTSSNCRCSAEELQRQYWQNQLREQEIRQNRTFNVGLSVAEEYWFYADSNTRHIGYTTWEQAFNRLFQTGTALYRACHVNISSVDKARDFVRDLQYGKIYISYVGHGILHHNPQPNSERTNRVISYLNSWISDYDSGRSVNKSMVI